jgi:hypothetical protein
VILFREGGVYSVRRSGIYDGNFSFFPFKDHLKPFMLWSALDGLQPADPDYSITTVSLDETGDLSKCDRLLFFNKCGVLNEEHPHRKGSH